MALVKTGLKMYYGALTMAKPKINYNKLQREYERRKQNQRRSDWAFVISPATPKDIQEANDVLFEGRYYKPTRKHGKKFV